MLWWVYGYPCGLRSGGWVGYGQNALMQDLTPFTLSLSPFLSPVRLKPLFGREKIKLPATLVSEDFPSMPKYSLFLLLLMAAIGNVNAQVFKCKGADGKTQFSDTPCKAGNNSEVVPDRAPVTKQQQYDAQQRAARLQDESAALDQSKANAQAEHQAQQQRQEVAKQTAPLPVAVNDTEAISNCVKDVERRGASQNVKAEMIAACRTAGAAQRSMGGSGDDVKNCVKNVERTGASEKEKARQLAVCHGGDVQPEPLPVVVKQKQLQNPSVIKNCSNGVCQDQYGNVYRKDVMGNLESSDGRRCKQYGTTLACD